MLTEGQRKANFEEYEAKKHEYAEKITTLKQSIKELYVEYANTQNVIMKFDDRSWKSRMKIAIFEISPGVKILFVPLVISESGKIGGETSSHGAPVFCLWEKTQFRWDNRQAAGGQCTVKKEARSN